MYLNNIVLYNKDADIAGCVPLPKEFANFAGLDVGKTCSFMHFSPTGIWCGCLIILTGFLSALTTYYKSNSL